MAELKLFDIPGAFNSGYDRGRQMRQANTLNQLAAQAYGAPMGQQNALVQQAIANDAGSGLQLGQSLATDEDRRTRNLVNMSRMLTSAPEQARPRLYQQMLPALQRFGVEAPSQYDDTVAQTAQAIVQAYGMADGSAPAGLREFQAMAQGLSPEDQESARRIALGLDPRASSAAIGYREITLPDGRKALVATDPRAVGAQILGTGETYGSGVPSPMASQGGDPFASLHAAVPGLRVTSQLRDPKRNAEAGGVPNSHHLTGDAIDIGTPTPEQQAGLRQWAAANGYRIKNDYADGHWHLEPARSGGAAPSPFIGPSEAQTAAAVEAAKLAEQLSALPAELRIRVESELQKQRGIADVESQTDRQSKARDAQDTLNLIAEARQILPSATGSLVGSGVDWVAGAVGESTPGAEATSRLQIISGQLIGKVPRFEGPQSDKDVQLYRQMAGDLANDKLPVARRLAALETMEALNRKAADQQAGLPPRLDPYNGGHVETEARGGVLRYNPATGNFE